MTPRKKWFQNRITECLENLMMVNQMDILTPENWEEFKNKSHELAQEITYVATEWDKFYKDEVSHESNR